MRILCIILVIVLVVVPKKIKEKGDYGDGGGTIISGEHNVGFFTPENEKAGAYGELKTNYYVRLLLKSDEYLLANLLLPLKNGRKTEIDCVLISRKGVFCIETKNWVGHISVLSKIAQCFSFCMTGFS